MIDQYLIRVYLKNNYVSRNDHHKFCHRSSRCSFDIRVSNATVSVANVENAHHSTRCKHQKMSKCDNGDQVTRTNNVEEYFGNEKPPRDPQRQGQYLRIDAGSHHQEHL